MNTHFYAQLNDEGVCMCISQLSGRVNAPNMIQISEQRFTDNLLGRRYYKGNWVDTDTPAEQI